MDEDGAIIPVEDDARGSRSLAREMADAYRAFVHFYQTRAAKTLAEAHVAATAPADDSDLARAMTAPPDQVSWHAISTVAERDPARGRQAWLRLVEQARDDLASGNRAARVMEGYNHEPWDRARFLVLRESLAQEWRPRNGIEWLLVEMLAQAFTLYEWEVQLVMTYTMMEARLNDHCIEQQNKYETPRLTSAETLARAQERMDRYQRMVLRVQRALRDQRRYGLNVGSVGQLNIGMVQQNVATPAAQDGHAKPSGAEREV